MDKVEPSVRGRTQLHLWEHHVHGYFIWLKPYSMGTVPRTHESRFSRDQIAGADGTSQTPGHDTEGDSVRYRDCPTIEVSERIDGAPEHIWSLVTDITLPTRFSPELERTEWIGGDAEVAIGARFRGYCAHPSLGRWHTECVVTELEPDSRWVWDVTFEGRTTTSWGFEVDPGSRATTVRHWARMGPGPSGLSVAIAAMPDKEGRIVSRRLEEFGQGMRATVHGLKTLVENTTGTA